MGWFYASSGNWTPWEQRINQVYSKIYFSYPPMSHSFATPISSHQLVSCPRPNITSCHWVVRAFWKLTVISIPYVSFLHYCSGFYLCSWPVLGQLRSVWTRGVTTLWSLWDLTRARVILTVKHMVGPGLIMSLCCQGDCLSSHLHLTQSSSPAVASSIGGGRRFFRANERRRQMYNIQHSKSPLKRRLCVLYPLQLPPPPPQTRLHQLLIQPISRAALFTRKLWSHPLTALPCLIVAIPCGPHSARSPPSHPPTHCTYWTTKFQHIHVRLHAFWHQQYFHQIETIQIKKLFIMFQWKL